MSVTTTPGEQVIHIDLGPSSYDAVVVHGNAAALAGRLRSISRAASIFIVTDTRVGPLHGPSVISALKSAGYQDIRMQTVPEGEVSKSIDCWTFILGQLHQFSQGKAEKPLILNLGGGMVGDLGGFVAATYTRGAPYVQIPTSLMAMVDSSLGGKVGIDYSSAKNIIGSFHQPKLVFADASFLKTLDMREMRAGLAEVVKYGVIKDPPLFDYVEANQQKILALDPEAVLHLIGTCLAIKARTVEKDPLDDKGVRVILNYGHTIGHAVEAASGFACKHGEAVAIGMVGANYIASEIGLLPRTTAQRINSLIRSLGLPTKAAELDVSRVLDFLARDKKFTERTNRFVLPTDIGSVKAVSGIDEALVRRAVESVTTP